MRRRAPGNFHEFITVRRVRRVECVRPIVVALVVIATSCGDTPPDDSSTLVVSEAPSDEAEPEAPPVVESETVTAASTTRPADSGDTTQETTTGADASVPATTAVPPPAPTAAPFPSRCEGRTFGQLGLIVLGVGVQCEEAQQVLTAYDGAEKAGSAAVGDAGPGWSCSTPSVGQRSTIDHDTGCASATASFTWLSDQSPQARSPTPVTPASNVLQPGQTGSKIEALQRELVRRGYEIGVDGVFGATTEVAVRSEQGRIGLEVDGLVGRNSSAAFGLGSDRDGGHSSPTDFSNDVHAWLADGAPGRLPGDALIALAQLADSDSYSDAASWSPGSPADGPEGRTHQSFVLSDQFPFRGLTICIDARARWCGTVSLYYLD